MIESLIEMAQKYGLVAMFALFALLDIYQLQQQIVSLQSRYEAVVENNTRSIEQLNNTITAYLCEYKTAPQKP